MKNTIIILSLAVLILLTAFEQASLAQKTASPSRAVKAQAGRNLQARTPRTKTRFKGQTSGQSRRQSSARKAARMRARQRAAKQRAARQRAAALRRAAKLERCSITLPQVTGRLPFGPGEKLSYVVKLGDIYVGRASLNFDKASRYGSDWIYAVHGQTKTNSFFNQLSQIESRMTSLISPDKLHPLAMYSRSVSQRGERVEEARFIPDERRVEASLTWKKRNWFGGTRSGQLMQDVLSVLYFARSREFHENQDFCTELYYGKRLWVIRGKLHGQRSISTQAGAFSAWKLEAVAEREGQPHFKRKFSMWISADDDRLPLRLLAPSRYGEILVDIDGFTRGHRLQKQQTTLAKDEHKRL